MNKKVIALMMAMVLLLGAAVGGTIAWLTAQTETVVNTFTVGDINIELTETGAENGQKDYKIIPGTNLSKDPTVTVKADSEACWLFVKVTETNWPANGKISYSVDTAWTKLEGVTGVTDVWYKEITTLTTADTPHAVLTNNQVTVSDTLTKAEAESLNDFTLTVKAAAVQHENVVAADGKTAVQVAYDLVKDYLD